jgi:hypothetical protein
VRGRDQASGPRHLLQSPGVARETPIPRLRSDRCSRRRSSETKV